MTPCLGTSGVKDMNTSTPSVNRRVVWQRRRQLHCFHPRPLTGTKLVSASWPLLLLLLFLAITFSPDEVVSAAAASSSTGTSTSTAEVGPDGTIVSQLDYGSDNDNDGDDALPCRDDDERCAAWADAGECTKNAGYMGEACRQSCGLCSSHIG